MEDRNPYILHNCVNTNDMVMKGARVSTPMLLTYSKISNIRGTLISNQIVDHSDVVGALPVGDAPTTSSF